MPIFDLHQIGAAVTQALADADVGAKQNAFVAVAMRDFAGNVVVRGVYAHRINETWDVRGTVAMDHEKHVEGGLQVKAVW